jgi:hypothetical protein
MYVTRSGRISKAPERYEPKEQVIDDFSDDESDIDESDIDESESDTESESDADEQGNLKDFVTYDDDEEEA